jgi:putative transposase
VIAERTLIRSPHFGQLRASPSNADFLVVPTVSFKLLYARFTIGHERRESLHVNVTARPMAARVIQQLREMFPDDTSIRYLIHDNDSILSDRVDQSISNFGIEPKGTSFRSFWQNETAERWVGTAKRDLLGHVFVCDESHIRLLLHDYVEYCNPGRVPTVVRDAPNGRDVKPKPSASARISGRPRLGGPHRRNECQVAA